ncbi:CdaR family transcriptional regulator [Mycolicibacterium sp. CBMA 226]|uniref:PucR family transcriptional regulator n=1 Tax=Mycolicibacterium sp. CBMA 226 TaxID=2606611 RepID=UPI0012DD8F92|nr:helix-turn-helix domain-containing protein [Mycolicibacterium sp. CBMA 226]MUL75131.1 PucR family transcriptional regulator [Mycolicibacterium sp. CBMA 226]
MVWSDEPSRIAQLAELFSQQLDAVGAEIVEAIVESLPLLGNDPAIRAELLMLTMWNVRSFLAAARSDDDPSTIVVPPETKLMARTLVHRGLEPEVAYEGCRIAEHIIWKRWLELSAGTVAPAELASVLRRSHAAISWFSTELLHQAIEAMREEQVQIAGGDLSRRIKMVRLLLDGVQLDDDMVSRSLRYDVRREHTALVIWADSGVRPGVLRSVGLSLARAIGAPVPLMIAAAADVLWMWIATPTADEASGLAGIAVDLVDAPVRVAIGPTSPGVDGFRRSHDRALAVHRMTAIDPDGARVLTHRELEVAALASSDEGSAHDFVLSTLGGLAEDTPLCERLRETLRVYLDMAENAPRASEQLHTHRNTVLQRVARATEILGYPPGERRLAVTLALELRRRLHTFR